MKFFKWLLLLPLCFSFSFANFGAGFGSGFATGYMLAKCQKGDCGICPDCYSHFTLGIGGLYLNQSKDFNSQDSGGYLAFSASEFSPQRRFQIFALSALLGAASHTSSPNALLNAPKSTASVFFELRPKVGINLLTKSLPLYLNLAYTFEGYNPNVGDSAYKLYSLLYHSVGGELEGMIFVNPKLRLTYSAGYDHIFSGSYKVAGERTSFSGGSTLRASVGYAYALSEKLEYYAKLNGKIQRFEAASPITSRSQEQYIAAFELGVGF